MGILLAFAPHVSFAVVKRPFGATAGLLSGMAASALLVARDALTRGGAELLEVGTLLLFSALVLYSLLDATSWSILGVRLCDACLLLIVITSVAAGCPSLPSTREQVSAEFRSRPEFIRTNTVIASVRTLAFAVVVGADLFVLFVPELPMRHSIVITVLALIGAFGFSAGYPGRGSARTAHSGI